MVVRRPFAAAGPVSDAAAAGASRLEGQTARALNLTSGGDRAELSFAKWGVSHKLEGIRCYLLLSADMIRGQETLVWRCGEILMLGII